MNRDPHKLLLECLAGLDAGLTPEQCLSAWPQQRAELEPMLRQALLLRVAFASAPSEEFRTHAREKVMFAAGREAREAFSAAPDEHFVRTTRQRLLNAAGASAQESLRAVAPPRLAFWANARRRLLEAGIARQTAAPAARPMALAFRTGLSAAIVVIAVAVAGLAYFTTASPQPSVSAEFAAIDQQLIALEQQAVAGNPVPATAVDDLSRRTAAAVDKLGPESSPSLSLKATDLIARQREVAQQTTDLTVAQEATQRLNQAEEKVDRIFAARADTPNIPTSQPTRAPSAPAAAVVTTAPSASSNVVPTTAPPAPTATMTPLGPNEIRVMLVTTDAVLGLTRTEVSTERLRMAMPTGWSVVSIPFDATGRGRLEGQRFRVQNWDASVILNVELTNSNIIALIDGVQVNLRSAGKNINAPDLVVKAPKYALDLSYILESVVYVEPTPTPTPTSTPTASPSPPPPPSVTPTP